MQIALNGCYCYSVTLENKSLFFGLLLQALTHKKDVVVVAAGVLKIFHGLQLFVTYCWKRVICLVVIWEGVICCIYYMYYYRYFLKYTIEFFHIF